MLLGNTFQLKLYWFKTKKTPNLWNFIKEYINAPMWNSSGHAGWEAERQRTQWVNLQWVNADVSETHDRMDRLITVSSQRVHKDLLEITVWLSNYRTQQTQAGLGWGSALPLGYHKNPLRGGLALQQYCNVISHKRNAGPVYTWDIYALITENQIQIGQFEYKFLHPKTPSFS